MWFFVIFTGLQLLDTLLLQNPFISVVTQVVSPDVYAPLWFLSHTRTLQSTLPTARSYSAPLIAWPCIPHWQLVSIPSQLVQMHTWVWGSDCLASSTPPIHLKAKLPLAIVFNASVTPLHQLHPWTFSLGNTSFLSSVFYHLALFKSLGTRHWVSSGYLPQLPLSVVMDHWVLWSSLSPLWVQTWPSTIGLGCSSLSQLCEQHHPCICPLPYLQSQKFSP